jgi:AraC family transcriptional regulator
VIRVVPAAGIEFLGKVAVDLQEALPRRAAHGGRGCVAARVLARGDGWIVEDVLCSCGPEDRPFEEQHDRAAVAIVMAGTFQYRGSGPAAGREMMTPGSLLLGNPGQYFECGHEHAAGDRCLSFRYTPAYFESITAGARSRDRRSAFGLLCLPPIRALSSVIAGATAALAGRAAVSWEELSVTLVAQAVLLDAGREPSRTPVSASAIARVTRTVRTIEHGPDSEWSLAHLARTAKLSPYHFLPTFQDLTGVTPHQYVMRTRIRRAATRLVLEPDSILDIALRNGFGDASNFNRAFRSEFGVSPRVFRGRCGDAGNSRYSR